MLLAAVVFIVPDSKGTTFFHTSTPLGTFSLDKLLVIASVGLGLFLLVIAKGKFKRSLNPMMIYLFVLWNVFLAVISLLTENAMRLNMLVFYMIMGYSIYFITYTLSTNFSSFKKSFIKFALIFAAIDGVIALWQSLTQSPLFMANYLMPDVTRGFHSPFGIIYRSWGLQGEPQAVGTLMAVALVILVSVYARNAYKYSTFKKLMMWTAGIIYISANIASFSRASWIALILAAIFIKISLKIRLFKGFRWILTTVVSAAFVYLIIRLDIWTLIAERGSSLGSSQSFSHRTNIIESVVPIMTEYGPTSILGLGAGGALTISDQYGALDNQFINVWFDSGIIGTILFFGVYIKLIFSKIDTTLRSTLVILLVSMISYQLLTYSGVGTLVWIMLGIASAEHALKIKEEPIVIRAKQRKPRKRYRLTW
ncbi:O-antigen ligase family protein [Terribacillus saccharophilus]|uniref:O-antigen ligase family protein n=1 Tax=Terribacillus saccharophilus TaxID=361277 RepID=UPI002DCF5FF0|nr:O-antigen ligase family protein [Terribacillus saccharophilus]MEC0288800.1 O-antigen ligase family protein [Terribacillus saccharophilus]